MRVDLIHSFSMAGPFGLFGFAMQSPYRVEILSCDKTHGSSIRMEENLKPIEQLVPVSYMCYHTSTPGLSTWWSSTALKGELVSRGVSRLDAFSGYPFRI